MNEVITVLEAVGKQGKVTRIAMEAQIALEHGDTSRASTLFHQAAEMMESAVSRLKTASERDLARFLLATHYYKGGAYEKAAKVCAKIQATRLPDNVRHVYPAFITKVKERSAPGYADRYSGILRDQYRRVLTEEDLSAAQNVIEILMEHPYLVPRERMAFLRARCCDIQGRQRAASLFFRDALQFDPENSDFLSLYLDSLCKEGRHAEAWAIVEDQLADHPGVRSSINAIYVINSILVRDGRPNTVADQEGRRQRRADQLSHFQNALEGYRCLAPAERSKIELLMDLAFLVTWNACRELNNPGKQLETLNQWVELRLDSPFPRVLRGMMTYPGDAANADFREAIRLQSSDPFPHYFLAYEALKSDNFHECDRLSTLALQRDPRPEMRAALLSWQAISRLNLGLSKPQQIRKLFDEAKRLKPDDSLIASYAQALDDDSGVPSLSSRIRREGEKRAREQVQWYVDELSSRIESTRLSSIAAISIAA
jgi:tetratricopeptide (TPR) repeat protein